MPMAFQLLLVISGVESPTQATEDSVLREKAAKNASSFVPVCTVTGFSFRSCAEGMIQLYDFSKHGIIKCNFSVAVHSIFNP